VRPRELIGHMPTLPAPATKLWRYLPNSRKKLIVADFRLFFMMAQTKNFPI